MHPCERCGAPIEEKYRVCYECMILAQADRAERAKASGTPFNARTGYTTTYTAPVANNASERKETTIMEAHEENIIATMALVDALKELAGAIRLIPEKGKGSQ